MSTRHLSIIAGLIVSAAAGAAGADFELPLELRPDGGKGGMRFISNGVPLLAGQATDVKQLRVVDPQGKAVPAQFRVLARWWRGDDSIRWVLVSFRRSETEGPKPVYKLVGSRAPAPAPKTALKLTETDELITVDTGKARFEVNRKRFNLLHRVVVGGETIVKPDDKLGSAVTDPKGRRYYSSAGTQSVRVLESGPVMVKVLAKGMHVSKEKGAFQPGLYGYEVTLTFWAGLSVVDVDAILTNNTKAPIGEPHFEDWSLLTRIPASRRLLLIGGKTFGPMDGSAVLYQDSVGTDRWRTNTGVKVSGYPKPPKPDLATFRGYKLWLVHGETRSDVATGDSTDGLVVCYGNGFLCAVSPRHFWQQFPSAIQYGSDGVVRLSPLPAEYKEVHWLEDASAKGQEFRLWFGIAEGDGRSPQAQRYQKPVFALPSPAHCGASGALSDLGPYRNHPKIEKVVKSHFSLAKIEKDAFSTVHGYGNGYGWQVFGMQWFALGGHTPWNYEPLAASGSLWMHLLSRDPGRLEWGLRVARHARDVRSYLIDGQDNLALWKDWKSYTANCSIEHYSRLVRGAIEKVKRKHPDWLAHPYPRQRWLLPNMSHLNLDEVYDLYLLTGDQRALRCMRTIADHGMAWILLRPGKRRIHRDEGWCLRTIARYYELTGDKRYLPVIRKCMDRIWRDVPKAGAWSAGYGGFYTAIFARGMMTAYLATGDERMRDLALGCADWEKSYGWTPAGYPFPAKKAPPWTMTPAERVGPKGRRGMCPSYGNRHHVALYAFAYQQTGAEAYREAFEFAWEKKANTWFQGYYPETMHMMYGPRSDRTAPAAVGDLAAKAGTGEVTLTWTAPGDDGRKGTATVVQIKHSRKSMLEFAAFPEQMKSHLPFWGAENVDGEPAPGAAGARESFTIRGLAPGKYWFALKTRDECNNQSAISNVVVAEVE